jgi:hypothetical protein
MIFRFQTVKLEPSNLQDLSSPENTLLDVIASGDELPENVSRPKQND